MSTATQKRKDGALKCPKSDISRAGVSSSRNVRHCIGRVEIDHDMFDVERQPCLALAEKLTAAGFPLNLGIVGPEAWHDEQWKWGKFREAAAKVGASWWAWHEDARERSFTFEWGSMANDKDLARAGGGKLNGGRDY